MPMMAAGGDAAPGLRCRSARKPRKQSRQATIGGGARPQPARAPITRVREFFPETMLWQPALITDDKGVADHGRQLRRLHHHLAAQRVRQLQGGAIGGATVPLKVFQDFFVDIDLPVHLTQNDEVAFPVAVYNYLKTPQTVKIELQKESVVRTARRAAAWTRNARSQAQRSHRRQIPHPRRQDRLSAAHRQGARHQEIRRRQARRRSRAQRPKDRTQSSATAWPATSARPSKSRRMPCPTPPS